MKLQIQLLHGRTHPDQELSDWGPDGPAIACEWFHVTYLTTFRLGWGEASCELNFHDDLLYYDGMYYGDFEIQPYDEESDPKIVDEALTIIPQ